MQKIPTIKRLACAAACLLGLAAGVSVQAQTYSNAVMALNPIGYWPLNETVQPPPPFAFSLTASNSGSLGPIGNGSYGAWYQPSGNTWFLTNNILQTNGIAGAGDKALWCKQQSGQYVVVPRTSGGVYKSNLTLVPPFSIEAWVIPNATTSGTYGIVAEGGSTQNYGGPNTNNPYYGGAGTGYAGVVVGQFNTFFLFDCFATNGTSKANELDSPTTGVNAPQTGKWNHLVCTFDGTTENMYLNNVLVAHKTLPKNGAGVTFAPDLVTPMMIGSGPEVSAQSGQGGITMNGVIDEVAIYNSVLPVSSINAHFAAATNSSYTSTVLSDNPMLYYQFNDMVAATNGGYPSGTFPIATNYGSLGVSANGVYQPGTTPGAAGPSYIGFGSNGAVALNGWMGAVDVGGGALPSALNPVGKVPFTVVSWFQGNSADAPARFQDIVGHGNNSYRLTLGTTCGENRFNPATTELQFFNPTDLITNHAADNDGLWHMVAGVTDGTNAFMYLDGTLMKSTNSITGINIPGSGIDVLLGGDPQFTAASQNTANAIRTFDGQIAQVAMWSNALSTAQIQSMYNAAGVPPYFVVQPTGLTTNQGVSVSIPTTVGGSQIITYQWYQNGSPAAGQTGAALAFAPITTNNAGSYYLVASNYAGVATSSVVNITVFGMPAVQQQSPTSLQIFAGSSPTLHVSATGAVPISYQWSVNGAPIGGATNSAYTVTNVQVSATYDCALSNSVGTNAIATISITAVSDPTAPYPATVLSDSPVAYFRLDELSGATAFDYTGGNNGIYSNVTLGVTGYNPQNSSQSDPTDPTETSVEFGDFPPNNDYAGNVPSYLNFGTPNGGNAEFSVEAWVTEYLFVNGGNCIVALGYGNGGEQFVLDTGGSTTGQLRFFVRNAAGTTASATATNILANDGLWHHVVGVCDEAGGHVYLYLDGAQLASGTIAANSGLLSSSLPLSIGARESANNNPVSYDYQFVGRIDDVAIYNKALSGATVQAHYLASGVPPHGATVQPSSITTNQGAGATFTASVQGTGPFTYQWFDPSNNQLAGQTNAALTLSSLQGSQSGNYTVQIGTPYGSTSANGALNVVLGAPQILTDISPLSQTVFAGDPVTFSVVVSGSLPLVYQWFRDGAAVLGATNSSYNFGALTGTNTYYVSVTNSFSVSQNGGPTLSSTAAVAGEAASFVNPSNFTSSLAIRFAGYTQNETLRDFPVLVRLGTNIPGFSYAQFASGSGGDLRFAEANTGRELPYEIDQWNDSNGVSSIWVQVPQIGSTNDYIWAFWGNAGGVTPPVYTTNGSVWLPEEFESLPAFDIVYHLKETGFPYADSALAYTSTNGVAPAVGSGIVGNGEVFDGSTTFLDSGTVTNLDDQFTLSAWINLPPTVNNIQTIWANQKGGFGSAGFSLFVNFFNTANQQLLMDTGNGINGGELATAAGTVSFGQWHQISAAVNRTNAAIKLYVDGIFTPTVSGSVTANFTNIGDLNLGRFTNSSLYFTGTMDEARIHQGVDSSNWVWASYMTVASNSVFSAYSTVSSTVPPQVLITIQRQANQVVLTWPQGTLQSAASVRGPYIDVSGAASPYTNAISATQQYYRVHVQ